jgi:hypothetical protein
MKNLEKIIIIQKKKKVKKNIEFSDVTEVLYECLVGGGDGLGEGICFLARVVPPIL